MMTALLCHIDTIVLILATVAILIAVVINARA
jgi:hypothetical protein